MQKKKKKKATAHGHVNYAGDNQFNKAICVYPNLLIFFSNTSICFFFFLYMTPFLIVCQDVFSRAKLCSNSFLFLRSGFVPVS